MHTRTALILSAALALPLTLPAQARPNPPARPAPAAPAQPTPTDKDVAATQRQLIELLRLSPTLTTVVAHDPSLLADQDYAARNNPQLAAFLAAHPEVARNPDFYHFTHMHPEDGSPDEALERAVWPDVYRMEGRRTGFDELLSDSPPELAFACFLALAAAGAFLATQLRQGGDWLADLPRTLHIAALLPAAWQDSPVAAFAVALFFAVLTLAGGVALYVASDK